MKKLFLIVVALWIAQCTFSQVKFGVKAGVNMSALSAVKSDGIKAYLNDGDRLGVHGGLFLNVRAGRLFGVQPELLFSMQGGKTHKASGNVVEEAICTFNYLNLPVLLELRPLRNLGILVGPQLGMSLSRSLTAAGHKYSGDAIKDYFGLGDDEHPFHKYDMSLVAGAQYEILNKVVIGARYQFGLSNSFKNDHYKGWRNSVWQISAGWVF